PNGSIVYRGKTINNSFNFPKYGQFQAAVDAQLTFVLDPLLQTQRANTSYGSLIFNHVNDGSFYGDASNLQSMATRIINAVKTKPKPFFLLGGYQRLRQDDFNNRSDPSSVDINMPRLVQLVDMLKSDASIGGDIEIVTPEYFSVLLRKNLGLSEAPEKVSVANEFKLLQNYPNPFNPSTTIRFVIKERSFAKIKIFNIIGEEVTDLVNQEFEPGSYEVQWNAGELSDGIYFVNLSAGKITKNIKTVFLK
ncbi:MAG: T9SS type A sorting domain-containing protein, partial [Ignavibacteriaceae bacterium]|nr:T9SS type A sorting domain-containing protein [Ignavibacteriaceae bacterium]